MYIYYIQVDSDDDSDDDDSAMNQEDQISVMHAGGDTSRQPKKVCYNILPFSFVVDVFSCLVGGADASLCL